jgi:hypothetical protein
MNAPAIQDPKMQALVEAIAQGLAPALNANAEMLTNAVGQLCAKFAEAAGNITTSAAINPNAKPKVCKIGGKCDGACDECQHSHMQSSAFLGAMGDAWTGLVTTMQGRGCGLMCRPLSPCFIWALQAQLLRTSLRRMYWMLERDDDSVELSQFVGLDSEADMVNVLETPMGSDKVCILAGSLSQLLGFIPAVTKVTANWTGTSAITKVNITLYQGPKGLTGLTKATLEAQCVPLGQTKKLSKWYCAAPNGQDGTCFVRPFPPFLGCSGSIIPDTETVYALIETLDLGDTEIDGFTIEVIKAGTGDAVQWCKTCNVQTDTWGMPMNLGIYA